MEPAAPEREEFDALATPLKALAHPRRLRLLRFLVDPHSLEEVASELGVARQSAQEHLDQLKDVGFVESRQGRGPHGPVTHYVTVVHRVFDLYDRLGVRLGILAQELEEDAHQFFPTERLPEATAAGRPAGQPRLIIVHGARVGQTIPLAGAGPWMIGRDAHATLCLDYDAYVSTRHAEVRRGPGGFETADAFSSNGTFVDWKRVPRGGTIPIANGALLRIGKSLVLFRTD